MSNLSPNMLEAAHGPEDITSDIADISQTKTGQFLIVNLSAQTSDTNFRVQTLEGETGIIDSTALFDSYDIFRNSGETILLASRDLAEPRTAFLETVASQVATNNSAANQVSTAMSKHLNKSEAVEVAAIRDRGVSQAARTDCSANGTSAIALKAA